MSEITSSGYLVNRALENLGRTLERGIGGIGARQLRREERNLMRKRAERLAPIEEMKGLQAQRWLERDQAPLTFGFLVGDNPNVAEHMLWSKSPKDKTLLDKTADMLNADKSVTQKGTVFISRDTGKEVTVGEAHRSWPQIKALYLSDMGIDRRIRSMREDLENRKDLNAIDKATYDSENERITAIENDPASKIRAAQKLIQVSQKFAHYPDIQANIERLENKITGWEKQISKAKETKTGRKFIAEQKRLDREATLKTAKIRTKGTRGGRTIQPGTLEKDARFLAQAKNIPLTEATDMIRKDKTLQARFRQYNIEVEALIDDRHIDPTSPEYETARKQIAVRLGIEEPEATEEIQARLPDETIEEYFKRTGVGETF